MLSDISTSSFQRPKNPRSHYSGAERVFESGYRKVGVLATESSVKARAYKERVHLQDNTISVQEIAAPELVSMIER